MMSMDSLSVIFSCTFRHELHWKNSDPSGSLPWRSDGQLRRVVKFAWLDMWPRMFFFPLLPPSTPFANVSLSPYVHRIKVKNEAYINYREMALVEN